MANLEAEFKELAAIYGDHLQENVTMANYTTSRVGGKVDGLLIVYSARELEVAATNIWKLGIPLYVIGNGSNVLISDKGLRGVVVINRAHNVRINAQGGQPMVWAESGANLSSISRQAALRALGGMEWASIIPGTLGGAVYGNAGAHGSNMNSTLIMAEILQPESVKGEWPVERMEYDYRSSILKRNNIQAVILSAQLKLTYSSTDAVQALMSSYTAKRHSTQPPGASMGSTFKNPDNDYAGRLIEAAGLKGKKIGGVEISSLHANFFINTGGATATDYGKLIRLVQKTVQDKFGIQLRPEIEFLGEWDE
jgi:UDP-N-acetylmuramate dehydrogenase